MALTGSFGEGLVRLEKGAKAYRIAMMCAESDPLDCHRCLLIGRALKARGHSVRHLLPDHGSTTQGEIEALLLQQANKTEADMFASAMDRLGESYRLRASKVAFAEARLHDLEEMAAE
jgi:Protein of unknown function, DUF488